MAECKDCIHYDMCKYRPLAIGVDICDVFRNTADVVPKSEVEVLQGALKAEERHNELTMEMAQKALANAKAEVAREIFEDIRDHFDRKIAFYQDMRFRASCKGDNKEVNYATTMITNLTTYKEGMTEIEAKYTD